MGPTHGAARVHDLEALEKGSGQRSTVKATGRITYPRDTEHVVERTMVRPSLASPGVECLSCCAGGVCVES